jgi:hypothetical protein
MNAIEILREHATPLPALLIARRLGKPIEDVYAELVAAEARGEARVVVQHKRGSMADRNWTAKK